MANKEGFLKLSEAPFLKYLLSFVIGVLLQMVFDGGYYIALPFVLLSLLLFYNFYKARLPKTKFAKRNYFGYAIFSLFIALGVIDTCIVSKLDTQNADFLKYIPGGMHNGDRIAAKRATIRSQKLLRSGNLIPHTDHILFFCPKQ